MVMSGVEPHSDMLTIATFLLALSSTSLSYWLSERAPSFACVPSVLFCVVAAVIPQSVLFLPLMAYDLGSAKLTGHKSSVLQGNTQVTIHWVWIVPILVTLFTRSAHKSSLENLILLTLTLFSALCCIAGMQSQRIVTLQQHIHRTSDEARQSERWWHTQLLQNSLEQEQHIRIATLAERTRIAREIHDNVGHMITRTILQTQALSVVAQSMNDSRTAQDFQSVQHSLNEAMTLIRQSVHDLEDSGTDFQSQISAAAYSLNNVYPTLHIDLDNAIPHAPAAVTRNFISIIHESLTNAIRHAHAEYVQISLQDFPAFWQLVILNPYHPTAQKISAEHESVEESGHKQHSMSTEKNTTVNNTAILHERSTGMGIADIEARARLLGGTALCGKFNNRWRVFVSIPKGGWHDNEQTDAENKPVTENNCPKSNSAAKHIANITPISTNIDITTYDDVMRNTSPFIFTENQAMNDAYEQNSNYSENSAKGKHEDA